MRGKVLCKSLMCPKGGIVPELLFGRNSRLLCGLKSFPTLVLFPLNPKHGPFACGLCSGTADPPKHGMWGDSPGCIPGQNAPAPPSAVSSPEVCFSLILIFAFYV